MPIQGIAWLGAVVLLFAVEAATVGLVSIWFGVGALAGLVTSFFTDNVWIQLTVFLVVAIVCLLAVRPLARRFVATRVVPTNADRILGRQAKVTEAIDNAAATGAVYADGKTWTARSADGRVIPAGELVEVERMEGVKLIVRQRAAVPA